MIQPSRAPVKPRVIAPEIGEAIPLEDVWLQAPASAARAIEILGAVGSGKTMALAHLAAIVPPNRNVLFLDDTSLTSVGDTSCPLVVFTSLETEPVAGVVSYRLAPWGDDELAEYLLAMHPAACRSVMTRLRAAPDRRLPHGLPELWRIVLDRMAEDESVTSVSDALQRELRRGLPTAETRAQAEQYSLAVLTERSGKAVDCLRTLRHLGVDAGFLRLLRHDAMLEMLAAAHLVRLLETRHGWHWLKLALPRGLVQATAAASPAALQNLSRWLREDRTSCHAMAASILHAADRDWVPGAPPLPVLSRAYLSGAMWKGVDLDGVKIEKTDLDDCDLTQAVLDRAQAHWASFRGALLHGASLVRIRAVGADFAGAVLTSVDARRAIFWKSSFAAADLADSLLTHAQLRGANLSDARLARADLNHASLANASIDGADFSAADLRYANLSGLPLRTARFDGAVFARAYLLGCDMEGMGLPGADFTESRLRGALLTGSRMRGACFTRADLQGAGLAEVDWEEANLYGADLRNCTFHLGTSRSGLVGSPIASEGSRTGFYGDEFDQQTYRRPEEIRKANLCRADLRNARLDGTDFYLVDLRGARYTPEQFEHLRRCGAILFDRA